MQRLGKTKLYPWMITNRHPIFMVGLLSFFIFPEILEKVLLITIPFPVLILILILSSMLLIHTSARKRIIANSLVLLLIIFVLLWVVFERNANFARLVFSLLFIYFSAIAYYLYRDLTNSERVTGSVIIGAFAGYFMIGVIFLFILAFLDLSFPDTINIDINERNGIQNVFYFSFVTLTTIGYGDFAPTSPLGQNIAILEGLIGQFYIAIVMATIVGKYISHSKE